MKVEAPVTERQTNIPAHVKKTRKKERNLNIFKYIFLWGYALITVGLFIWVTLTAFKDNTQIFTNPFGLPESYSFSNFAEAWTGANMSQFFVNSLIVSVISVSLCLFLGATLSFVIARFRFRGNGLLYALFVLGLAIPLQSLILPIFFRMDNIGLRDSLLGLILVYTALNLPKTVFLLVGFMKGIPSELEEAAIIDGCGYWKIFSKVIVPISKPGLATAGILVFIAAWNEYVFATVLISSDAARTLPLGLASFQTSYASAYGLIAAGVVISVIPVLIVYILLQEQIIKGMTAGSVKG
ncbi:carbohydrate ABC transporter permease [Aquibacillus koreensis]|uniref:Carbohydrate ABC transporter permease n=1 Tax=Aquibacillus koreensis TaxID=279446 RepID=A0A9X3WMR6_9BACI|nr:carbohydrate ABC transporter permease [Aquibacillus koreensis]MCT2536674.1 carbohydrate ABC transporter permease [Aquibacillus koreensis]MDC3422627.1 carbohydrate ABC transporter permease [Aquibacillus koreensis]